MHWSFELRLGLCASVWSAAVTGVGFSSSNSWSGSIGSNYNSVISGDSSSSSSSNSSGDSGSTDCTSSDSNGGGGSSSSSS